MGIQIAPRMLSADFASSRPKPLASPAPTWSHRRHGRPFRPDLTLVAPVIEALAKVATQPIDAHLIIEDPDLLGPRFAEAEAKRFTFHVEAARRPAAAGSQHPHRGRRASMAFKPDPPLEPYVGPAPRDRHDLDHDGRARLRRGVAHGLLSSEGQAGAPADGKHGRDIWFQVDGGSRSRRSSAAPRLAPTCSLPARPCSAPTSPTPWSPALGHMPNVTPTDHVQRLDFCHEQPVLNARMLRGRCNSEPAVIVRDPRSALR